MFRIREPSVAGIRRFLDRQRDLPFSYPETGATRAAPPAGYVVDRNRVRLGEGDRIFRRCADALRSWEHFGLGWVRLCWPEAGIEPGTDVAILVHRLGLWSLNACRVVYRIDEPARFGFAYGTLPAHAERGEERFMVERLGDGSVWYDILAFSRPASWLTLAGYPVVRRLQREFARDSMAAMVRETRSGSVSADPL